MIARVPRVMANTEPQTAVDLRRFHPEATQGGTRTLGPGSMRPCLNHSEPHRAGHSHGG